MGGGPVIPPMPASERNFDVVMVGGHNAVAMTRFLQFDEVNYKMALVTKNNKFIVPQCYYPVSHGHIKQLELESSSVSA